MSKPKHCTVINCGHALCAGHETLVCPACIESLPSSHQLDISLVDVLVQRYGSPAHTYAWRSLCKELEDHDQNKGLIRQLQEEVEALTGSHEECNKMTGIITGLRDELTVVKADLAKEREETRRLSELLEQCRVLLTKALRVLQMSRDIDLIKAIERLVRV